MISTEIPDCLIIRSILDPSVKNNMIEYNSGHPLLVLDIRLHKSHVLQHPAVCKHTCKILASTYMVDSLTGSLNFYRGS